MPIFGPGTVRVDPEYVRLIRLLIGYHNDGDYLRDVVAVGERAIGCVREAPEGVVGAALVLDIDETSLANDWPHLLRPEAHGAAGERYTYYDENAWNHWVKEARAPPIDVTLEISRLARSRDWTLFFITGRPSTQRMATETNLRRAGYDGWTEVVMREEVDRHVDASVFKSAARRRIAEGGYRIMVNVGDQASDLSGGFAEHTFKLPNPFYFVP
jgi:acid phosphatase